MFDIWESIQATSRSRLVVTDTNCVLSTPGHLRYLPTTPSLPAQVPCKSRYADTDFCCSATHVPEFIPQKAPGWIITSFNSSAGGTQIRGGCGKIPCLPTGVCRLAPELIVEALLALHCRVDEAGLHQSLGRLYPRSVLPRSPRSAASRCVGKA